MWFELRTIASLVFLLLSAVVIIWLADGVLYMFTGTTCVFDRPDLQMHLRPKEAHLKEF